MTPREPLAAARTSPVRDPGIPAAFWARFGTPTVFLDFETTGIDPDHDQIIEIGAIRYEDGVEVERYRTFCRLDRPLSFRIRMLTGILDADLAAAPEVPEAIAAFARLLRDDAIIFAHNAAFEAAFLARSLGGSPGSSACLVDSERVQFVDTCDLANLILPTRGQYNLEGLIADLGIRAIEAHRGLEDALDTRTMTDRLIEIAIERFPPARLATIRDLFADGRPATSRFFASLHALADGHAEVEHREVAEQLLLIRDRPLTFPEYAIRREWSSATTASLEARLSAELVANALDGGTLVLETGDLPHGVGAALHAARTIAARTSQRVLVIVPSAEELAGLADELEALDVAFATSLDRTTAFDPENGLCLHALEAARDELRVDVHRDVALLMGAYIEAFSTPGVGEDLGTISPWLLGKDPLIRRVVDDLRAGNRICAGTPSTACECPHTGVERRIRTTPVVVATYQTLARWNEARGGADQRGDGSDSTPWVSPFRNVAHVIALRALALPHVARDEATRKFEFPPLGDALREIEARMKNLESPRARVVGLQAGQALRAAQELDRVATDRFTQRAPDASRFPESDRPSRVLFDRARPEDPFVESFLVHALDLAIPLRNLSHLIDRGAEDEPHFLPPRLAESVHRAAELLVTFFAYRERGFTCHLEPPWKPAGAGASGPAATDQRRSSGKPWSLVLVPRAPEALFAENLLAGRASVALVSPHLTFDGGFDHFRSLSGTDDRREGFRALSLGLGAGAPRLELLTIGSGASLEDIANLIEQVIVRRGGRVAAILTSFERLRKVEKLLMSRLEERGVVCFCQHTDGGKTKLLQRVSRLERAVLLGGGSFLEGPGSKPGPFDTVLLDRLPFPYRDDPRELPRREKILAEGRDEFQSEALPRAVLRVRSALGLFSPNTENPLLILADPRLRSAGYFDRVLRNLPLRAHHRSLDGCAGS